LGASRDDVYAFAHSLVYLTDFGAHVDGLPRSAAHIVADAEPALARCLDDDDFDLSGEILLTWPLLRAAWSPSSAFGFQVLCRVEDEVGFLPSLSLRGDRYRELEGVARTRYTVAEAYHTVYVMGLLCAATLQCKSPLPTAIAAGATNGISDELIDQLIPADPEPQWQQDFSNLEPAERDTLASFLATVALHRAVSTSDLVRVRAILTLCVERALEPSVAMVEATDLLSRFASSPYASSVSARDLT
jgi:hypothetical protein